jgi:uncharacterized protein (TIGR03435 family)
LALCVLDARAESFQGPDVGDAAPSVRMSKWLQAPGRTPLGWPAGKVVVLEFWSTWCGPCVGAIPHLNSLAEQFKGRPVQFIAITDEKESVVEAFLTKTPVKAWIGLAVNSIFGEANPYRVYAIPHTVIVDANGRVAAVMNPTALDSAEIELCLAGKSAQASLPEVSDDTGKCPPIGVVPSQSLIGRTPMFQVMIRPVLTNQPGASRNSAGQPQAPQIYYSSRSDLGLSMPGGRLKEAILSVFNTRQTRLAFEAKLPNDRYDFYISLAPRNLLHGGHMLETVFSQAVEATFGLIVRRETRSVDSFVLRANASTGERLARDSGDRKDESYTFNEITGINRSLDSLAEGVENAMGKPVLNETGITNLYSFHLRWDQKDFKHPNSDGMTVALKEIGLQLAPEKRPLDIIVVRAVSE